MTDQQRKKDQGMVENQKKKEDLRWKKHGRVWESARES